MRRMVHEQLSEIRLANKVEEHQLVKTNTSLSRDKTGFYVQCFK
jgi:hypothetical protein